MVNGQPYLISVNQNDNVAALVTLASTKESLNAAPQSSINASFTTVVSSNTPVMSVKASASSDSKDNVSSKSVWKPPLSVLNTTNIIGKPRTKSPSPINSMGLSVEQLMELKDIMLREHGQLLDRQQLDYINSYTKNLLGKPVSTVKKSATKKQKSTIQTEGRPVFEQMLESMTRKKKKKSDTDYSPPQLQRRKTGGEIELHSSASGQNVQSKNKNNNTECDNDLDAMIVDFNSSDKSDVTTFYSDRTFTGPALVPPRSPVGPDKARPMLLFRSDIARKLKPAILRESDMPSSVNKTTSITSPMVFSIITTMSSNDTVSIAVTTRTVSTTSSVSFSNRMDIFQLSSSTVSPNVGKASPIFGNRNAAGKAPSALDIELVPGT